MLAYLLIVIIIIVMYKLNEKLDNFKEQIKKDDIPELYKDLASTKDRLRAIENRDVNTNLKSNTNTTNDTINTHDSVMTIDTEKNLYEAQLYKLIDKVHKSKINNRYKIKDLDTEIKLFKDNSLAVVITSDIEESKVLGVSVYDIDDLDDIKLLYTT
ncbi:MAG: hypothetical protein K9L56_15230 [Clostridiales bacterium]|nr:hypothetical protein [Clostridiales bacterium]